MPRKAKKNSRKSLSHPRSSVVLANSAIANARNVTRNFELARGAATNPPTNGTVPDMLNVTEVNNVVQQSVEEEMRGSFSSWMDALSCRCQLTSRACAEEASNPGAAAAFVAEKESWRRKAIWKRVQDFRNLTGIPIPSHIVSVIVGNEEKALLASRHLLKSGFHVTAIRPPTVPPNSCRLRITLTAAHTRNDVKKLAAALSHCVSFQDVYVNTSELQAKL